MLINLIFLGLLCLVLIAYFCYQSGIKNALESTTIPLFVLNTQGAVIYRNSASNDLFLPTLLIEGTHYICTDLAIYLKGISKEPTFSYEFKDEVRGKEYKFEGRKVWFETHKHWLVSVRRQVDRASAEAAAKQSKQLIHHVFQSLPDAIGMMNDEHVYEACNQAFSTALGINDPEDLLGKKLEDVASKEIAEKFFYSDKRVLDTGEEFHIIDETFDQHGNKQWLEARKIAYTDPVTKKRGLFIFARDISASEVVKEKLSVANNDLKRLSFLDGLTNVGNRRYFEDTLVSEWQNHSQTQMPLSLIKCEIASFPTIIEKCGVEFAEKIIVDVSEALEASLLRIEDRVYRYSGEEFAFILANTDEVSTDVIVKRILKKVEQLNGGADFVQADITIVIKLGAVSCFPSSGVTCESAMKRLNESLCDYSPTNTKSEHQLAL